MTKPEYITALQKLTEQITTNAIKSFEEGKYKDSSNRLLNEKIRMQHYDFEIIENELKNKAALNIIDLLIHQLIKNGV